MDTINTQLDAIPHGHGLSFKKGIADGLLDFPIDSNVPNGHERSYRRGYALGQELKNQVSQSVS